MTYVCGPSVAVIMCTCTGIRGEKNERSETKQNSAAREKRRELRERGGVQYTVHTAERNMASASKGTCASWFKLLAASKTKQKKNPV